jgi:hypothetical protein
MKTKLYLFALLAMLCCTPSFSATAVSDSVLRSVIGGDCLPYAGPCTTLVSNSACTPLNCVLITIAPTGQTYHNDQDAKDTLLSHYLCSGAFVKCAGVCSDPYSVPTISRQYWVPSIPPCGTESSGAPYLMCNRPSCNATNP